ncbi:MAG TPA: carboxypeptidase regulatory-like domain-containing protein [Castellaniella sp.]|nr:carboxypeptidase regulatory-like domain-containing protein [Castellaniella sp.]
MPSEPISHVFSFSPRAAVLAALALAGAACLSPAQAALPALQHQGGVDYVSGGIGIDESTSFKEAMRDFPLSMTFDQRAPGQGPGDYVADVQVGITDAEGRPVLDATAQGPYLLVRLPDGQYRVKATYQGRTQTREVTIGGKKPAHLGFSWPEQAEKP